MSVEIPGIPKDRIARVIAACINNVYFAEMEFSEVVLDGPEESPKSLVEYCKPVSFASLFHQDSPHEGGVDQPALGLGRLVEGLSYDARAHLQRIIQLRVGRSASDNEYAFFGDIRDEAKTHHGGAVGVRENVLSLCRKHLLPSALVVDWVLENNAKISSLYYPTLVAPGIALQYLQKECEAIGFSD